MANIKKPQLKIPRHIIALMVGDNPQAIRAFEKLQSNGLYELPVEIERIYTEALAQAQQAMMMANQALQQAQPQLNAVSVPSHSNSVLDSVNVSIDTNNYLESVCLNS